MAKNKGSYIKVSFMFCIGAFSGWIFSECFINHAKDVQILYLSQDEITVLEKERVKIDDTETGLFYGRIEEAIMLIEKEANKQIDRNNKLIFSRGAVSGTGVKSISEQVYRKVLAELQKETLTKDI